MGKNYYSILRINRTASDVELKKGFRKQALIWHPERNPQDVVGARTKFDDICEAYCVLSNLASRAIYDIHGEEILKRGIPDGYGGYQNAWVKTLSSEQVFNTFFGSSNPFMVDERVMAESLPVRAVLQIEPIKCVIYAALEEIYSGFLRSVTITRQIMNHDQKTSSDQEVTLKVPIAKGAIAGTKVLFESAGHQRQGQTGHVEFEIRIAPHPIYRREGDNLVVKKELYITEALTGGSVRISTLDGRTLSIAISKVILPGSRTLVSGEGLIGPTGNRGDLFIEYQVKYPDQISLANKQALRHLLPVPVDG